MQCRSLQQMPRRSSRSPSSGEAAVVRVSDFNLKSQRVWTIAAAAHRGHHPMRHMSRQGASRQMKWTVTADTMFLNVVA